MKTILFSIVTFLVLLIASCKSDSNKTGDTIKKKTADETMKEIAKSGNINVSNINYTVDIPAGWGTKDTMMNGVQFHFLTAPVPEDNFNTNMNVLNESMQNMDFDEYKKKTQETMKTYMPSFSVIKSGDIDAVDLKGSWFIYAMEQNGIKMDIINYTFPKDGIAYIIAGAAKAGSMDKYRTTFDAVAKSFKLKN